MGFQKAVIRTVIMYELVFESVYVQSARGRVVPGDLFYLRGKPALGNVFFKNYDILVINQDLPNPGAI